MLLVLLLMLKTLRSLRQQGVKTPRNSMSSFKIWSMMDSIYLSLWDSYADRILEHWENREQHGVIFFILQFATLKYFGRFGYVNNCFNVSKLFINSDVDEMTSFRLLQTLLLLHVRVNLLGLFLSLYDEYVVRSEFNNIAEVNLNQAKSVVVVSTVQMISEDFPWYYFACKACNKKVFQKVNNDTPTVGVFVDEEEVYECKTATCKDTVIQYTQRLKIPLTVQDSSGTVSLTLFDRDACRILKTTAANLIVKHVAGGDKGLYPDEFEALLGKNAFKIDISEFNIENNFWFFSVSKLTDDEDIIFELEKKANKIEDDNSTDVIMGVTVGTKSNEDVKSKVTTESMDDNVITPLAKNLDDTAMASKPFGEPAIFKRKTKKPAFKKNLVDSYDVDENGEMSTTKPVKPGKPTLLIPKIEK
ncbi:putative nucleic acid-binding, replication factor A [Helianthus anomalus]